MRVSTVRDRLPVQELVQEKIRIIRTATGLLQLWVLFMLRVRLLIRIRQDKVILHPAILVVGGIHRVILALEHLVVAVLTNRKEIRATNAPIQMASGPAAEAADRHVAIAATCLRPLPDPNTTTAAMYPWGLLVAYSLMCVYAYPVNA